MCCGYVSMKRTLFILLALGLLVAGITWSVRQSRDAGDAAKLVYTYAKPQLRDLRQVLTVNGTITPVLSTEIKSEVNGRIAVVRVNAGDVVTAGQVLVELDLGPLRAQIDSAQLAIASARLRVESARQDLERATTLAKREFFNAKDLETAQTAYLISKNDLDVQGAQMRVLEDSLKKTTIAAPYAGTILSVAARPGMVVTGAESGRDGNTLLELADLSRLRVEANINEIDVIALTIGMPVDITFESMRDLKAAGHITFISPAAGRNAQGGGGSGGQGGVGGGGSSTTHEFPVQIAVEQAGPRIRPGMTARLGVETGVAHQALSVAVAAVFYDFEKEEAYVFVRQPAGEPVRRKIVTGVRSTDHVEIKEGLAAGEEISLQKPASERRKTPPAKTDRDS